MEDRSSAATAPRAPAPPSAEAAPAGSATSHAAPLETAPLPQGAWPGHVTADDCRDATLLRAGRCGGARSGLATAARGGARAAQLSGRLLSCVDAQLLVLGVQLPPPASASCGPSTAAPPPLHSRPPAAVCRSAAQAAARTQRSRQPPTASRTLFSAVA